jgi:hypothetical protein
MLSTIKTKKYVDNFRLQVGSHGDNFDRHRKPEGDFAMTQFRTLLLLDNLRGILSSFENNTEMNQRCRSIAPLKSALQQEIETLEREIDRCRMGEPEP